MKVCSTTAAPLTLLACASQLRKFIIDNILATDMTCHFGLTEELKKLVARRQKASNAARRGSSASSAGSASPMNGHGAGAGAGAGAGSLPNGSSSPSSASTAAAAFAWTPVRAAAVWAAWGRVCVVRVALMHFRAGCRRSVPPSRRRCCMRLTSVTRASRGRCPRTGRTA